MSETRRWPDMDPDEERFVGEFGPSLGTLGARMQGCPPLDVLLAADAKVLPAPAADLVAAHLDRCALCQATLRDAHDAGIDTISDDEAARVLYRASATTRPADSPRLWMYLTAASVAATVLVGAWAFHLQSQNQSLSARLATEASSDQTPQLLADLKDRLSAEQARAAEAESALATLKRPAPPQPVLNVPLIDLEPVDALRSASAGARVEVPAGAAMVSLVLSASAAQAGAEYALDIHDARDALVWQGTGLRKSALNTFTLVVPRALLPAGAISLRLYAVGNGRRRLEHQYRVQIVDR